MRHADTKISSSGFPKYESEDTVCIEPSHCVVQYLEVQPAHDFAGFSQTYAPTL